MSRRDLNQRLARIEARLERIDPNPTGPSRAFPLDMLSPADQDRATREGNVYEGKVWG